MQLETRLAPASLSTLVFFTGNGGAAPGSNPNAGLIADTSGNLYGTTKQGGSSNSGTVFELVKSSGYAPTILHSFAGGSTDGASPIAGLIADSSGNLFGTTAGGGATGVGTVFELVKSSGYTETILHFFTGGSTDGAAPYAGLIADSSGNLFGTTAGGGSSNSGTVFELVKGSGYAPTILHSFTFGSTDGASPIAGLIADSSGNLFGTTGDGGLSGGTVFELVKSSGYAETILHSFTGGSTDGDYPYAGLIADGSGNLFGTTKQGGAGSGGTVFELVKSSGYTETILHFFTGGSTDGYYPYGGLIADGSGNLFGTTEIGGTSGVGTVFELVNSSGSYALNTLYAFGTATNDGANPYAGLVRDSSGNLFGTTESGGVSNDGTVFEVNRTLVLSSLPIATVSDTYNQTVTASNGVGPYTFAVTVGSLPAGLSLNPNSGQIFGTPTAAGTFAFTIGATDSLNATGSRAYNLEVDPAITLSPGSVPQGTANTTYPGATIQAGGGSGTGFSYFPSGALDGLSLNSSTGALSGTLTAAGTFIFTVTATDGIGATGSQSFFLTVYAPPANVIRFSGNGQSGTADANLSNPLVVEVTDSSGNPVAGVTVNWAAATGGGSVSAATSTTATNGLAMIAATLGTTPGTNAYTATIGTLPPVTFMETARAAPVATSITVSAGSPQSIAINTAFVTNLAATVTDQFGNPVAGVTVVFAAPSSGPGGIFTGSTNTITETTNASGLATAPIFTANIYPGSYTVSASTSGVGTPASFSLTNLSSLGTSANDVYVHNIYALLLKRVPDAGADYWVNLLNAGTSASTVVRGIESSSEYLQGQVKALYLHYLARPADPGGLQYWTKVLVSGATIEQVIDGLVGSPEYFTLHGSNNQQFVQALYNDILGRPGSSSEWQGWVNILNSEATRAQVAGDFLTSHEYRTNQVAAYYTEFLRRPADSGGQTAWVNQLASGVSDQAVLAAIFGSAEGFGKWS